MLEPFEIMYVCSVSTKILVFFNFTTLNHLKDLTHFNTFQEARESSPKSTQVIADNDSWCYPLESFSFSFFSAQLLGYCWLQQIWKPQAPGFSFNFKTRFLIFYARSEIAGGGGANMANMTAEKFCFALPLHKSWTSSGRLHEWWGLKIEDFSFFSFLPSARGDLGWKAEFFPSLVLMIVIPMAIGK